MVTYDNQSILHPNLVYQTLLKPCEDSAVIQNLIKLLNHADSYVSYINDDLLLAIVIVGRDSVIT